LIHNKIDFLKWKIGIKVGEVVSRIDGMIMGCGFSCLECCCCVKSVERHMDKKSNDWMQQTTKEHEAKSNAFFSESSSATVSSML